MITPLLFGSLGFWEILLIVLVVILLFGGKKIPELMRGLGKGVKNFKEGMKEVEEDVKEIKAEGKPSQDAWSLSGGSCCAFLLQGIYIRQHNPGPFQA